MIKSSINQEDITIINMFAPSIGVLEYIKQIFTDCKEEVDSNTILVEGIQHINFKKDRSSRHKIDK